MTNPKQENPRQKLMRYFEVFSTNGRLVSNTEFSGVRILPVIHLLANALLAHSTSHHMASTSYLQLPTLIPSK